MPEDNKDLIKLKKKKASIKAKLTQFETHLDLAKSYAELSEVHANELKFRLTRIENILQEFDILQTEIESLCDCPDEQYADRDLIETQYYRLVASAHTVLAAKTNKREDGGPRHHSCCGSGCSDVNSGGTCNQINQFQLPKIHIPQFDGAYQSWLEFRDAYL